MLGAPPFIPATVNSSTEAGSSLETHDWVTNGEQVRARGIDVRLAPVGPWRETKLPR